MAANRVNSVQLTVDNKYAGRVLAQIQYTDEDGGVRKAWASGPQYVAGSSKREMTVTLEEADMDQGYTVLISGSEQEGPLLNKSFSFCEANTPSVAPGSVSAMYVFASVMFTVLVVGIIVLLALLTVRSLASSGGSPADGGAAADLDATFAPGNVAGGAKP